MADSASRSMATMDDRLGAAYLWRELGRLEDQAAAGGWGWDAGLSLLVDALVIVIEKGNDRR